jgi:hypothetical protein
MSRPLRKLASLAGCLLAIVPCSVALASETVAPLPESDYTTRAACQAPTAGQASCMALQLIPVTAEARRRNHPLGIARQAVQRSSAPTPKEGFLGLRPEDLHVAYSLPNETAVSATQTIALVDAYNDPTAEADLKTYDEEFKLPPCTKENECFTQIGQSGSETELPFPESTAELETAAKGTSEQRHEANEAIGWGTEISLDVQTAHAICESCRIVLVEADNPLNVNLVAAERRAEAIGANEISNSWGTGEEFVGSGERQAFNHPKTVITASAGDDGYRGWARGEESTSFPASYPGVVAVGGTRLRTLGLGGAWQGETVWNGAGASGGGCSTLFTAQPWQQEASDWASVGCGAKRAANDVSADADPYTGIVIRDTDSPGKECREVYEESGTIHTIPEWCTYGGTSLSSPIIASVYALAGGAGGVEYPAQTLYRSLSGAPASLHDVTVGSNGLCGSAFDEETGLSTCSSADEAAASCSSTLACLAAPGYDGPSGVGTPNGIAGFIPAPTSAPAAAPQTGTQTAAPAPVPPAPTVVPAVTVQLRSLGLTTTSLIALSRRPVTSKVGFSFTLNMAVAVRVTLARRVRSHGHLRWVTIGHAVTAAATVGHNVKRLPGARHLPSGLYRLTATPRGGASGTIFFHIG